MEIKDKAITCFRNGYNCAQAVALVFNIEENGAVRAASAFGGGMGRMQQT
ncbi:MAG TPA: C-GCAxxG-C-C family (seleno)protein [Bacteroidales bacterium]|nr:C-GCAxxG-C-C family (seleno)protein [Bacteroidales bacterium]